MTRAAHIHQARVYLAQARATKHRGWRFRLMEWAADRYRMAVAEVGSPAKPPRIYLFSRRRKPKPTPQLTLL